MSIITLTIKLNAKNMRTVNTKNGEKQVVSAPVIKDSNGKWVYASAFINFPVKHGDILTISGRVEQKEDREYLNNNFVFPTVERLYQPQQSSPTVGYPENEVPNFGEEPAEISNEQLPFN